MKQWWKPSKHLSLSNYHTEHSGTIHIFLLHCFVNYKSSPSCASIKKKISCGPAKAYSKSVFNNNVARIYTITNEKVYICFFIIQNANEDCWFFFCCCSFAEQFIRTSDDDGPSGVEGLADRIGECPGGASCCPSISRINRSFDDSRQLISITWINVTEMWRSLGSGEKCVAMCSLCCMTLV